MSNKIGSEIISEISRNLMDQIDVLETRNAQNIAFLSRVVKGWKDGTLTAERIQILENGDMRILEPEPLDNVNGKVTEKNPLAEPVVAEKQKLVPKNQTCKEPEDLEVSGNDN